MLQSAEWSLEDEHVKQKANIDRTEGHQVELNFEACVFFLGPVSSIFSSEPSRAGGLSERSDGRHARQGQKLQRNFPCIWIAVKLGD